MSPSYRRRNVSSMRSRSVLVLGGGVAGLSVALMLARDGHSVTVVERDLFLEGSPQDAPTWPRRGIPHFLQPHAFIPRGRLELRDRIGDVYDALVNAGARDVDLRPKLPGSLLPEDNELQYLAVRRPIIEWGLRQATRSESRIAIRSGAAATGLHIRAGTVMGAEVDGETVDADLVVDALGRRSPTAEWLSRVGIATAPPEDSDCGVVYFSRYYRVRDGVELPDGPWLLSPRGDLGYLGYSTFPGDNRTFAALLAVPPGEGAWRRFRTAAVFEAAVAQIPALRAWVDPHLVDPITDVLTMANLRNALRSFDASSVAGFVPIGDAICHTDPVLAHGLSFALIHARALTDALREHDDVGDAVSAFVQGTAPLVRERYDFATALDEQRLRMWTGGHVDYTSARGDGALFSMIAAGVVAMRDPEIFRVFVRRIGLLDSTEVLDSSERLQQRIENLYTEATAIPRPPAGPTRDEMVAITSTALAGE